MLSSATAQAELNAAPSHPAEPDLPDLVDTLIERALSRRADRPSTLPANLYIGDCGIPQIELFKLLSQRLPLITTARRISNGILARALGGRDSALLLDVGIGGGHQVASLLEDLARARRMPRQLTVMGIDPSPESLEQAGDLLRETVTRLGVARRFRYCAIAGSAEDLSERSWSAIRATSGEIAVNAAFALHHIRHVAGPNDLKDHVLRRIRALDPLAFVLIEPDSDHHTDDLSARVRNCRRHYGLAFALIDTLDISPAEKLAIKTRFFGREIEDILGKPERQRTERHETARMWKSRLERAGFSLRLPRGTPLLESDGTLTVAAGPGYYRLEHRQEPVVSILNAV